MNAMNKWLLTALCLSCVAAAIAAPDWTSDQRGQGYGYNNGHHKPPHH